MTPDPIEAVARAMAPSAFLPFDRKMHGSPANHEAAKKMWLKNAATAIAAMPKVDPIKELALDALDIADRLIERGYGDEMPEEWDAAYRAVANAVAAFTPEPDTIGYVDDTGGAR